MVSTINGQCLTVAASSDAWDDNNETGLTYLSKRESDRPNRPGPVIVKCWQIETSPASHGMRVDRSSSVDMSVKILYSTIGRGMGLKLADDNVGDLEATTGLVT
jgi:hypothetical protein